MIPEFLKNKLTKYYKEDYIDITNSYSKSKYPSIRVNTIKTSKEEVIETLNKENIVYEESLSLPNAIILKTGNLKESSLYQEGKIYYQSLSSQIPPFIVDPKENENILDMTAAPGGKTTQMSALSNNKTMITAIEKNKIRADRLRYNIEKQGAKKVTILQVDSRNLDEYFLFDKILLDAPCSGSGTIINNDYSKISEELITRSVETQKSLLKEAIKHLKVGGELTYSTCSILKEENEKNIIEILKENPNLELIPLDNKFSNTLPTILEGTITIKPNEYYEGFFIAKIKKFR